jgi:hypothetical protein
VREDGRGLLVVLLETDPGGSPTRLEVSSAAGLLTLHPEADGREAHGNVVGPDGVRPLAFPWGPTHGFDVVDLPEVLAACGGEPAGRGGDGARGGDATGVVRRPVLLVDRELRVVEATAEMAGGPAGADGASGHVWPLE